LTTPSHYPNELDGKGKKRETNEPPHGKPPGIFKGKIHFIAASCGELSPIDFESLLK
jgi:hypothetical protein